MRADLILRALARRHTSDIFLTEVKTGPTLTASKGELRRIDALVIKQSWARPLFTAYEVKVSRSDFLNDDKWTEYLPYCHRFYFACPAGLIQRDEVPDPAGLAWVDPDTLEVSVRKAARSRMIDIPWELLYYIVISKLESDRHPFFSSQREMLEVWVEDKTKRKWLGLEVATRMAERVREAEYAIFRAEIAERELERYKKGFSQLWAVMKECGWPVLPIFTDEGLDRVTLSSLREAFSVGSSPVVNRLINDAIEKLKMAKEIMANNEEVGGEDGRPSMG